MAKTREWLLFIRSLSPTKLGLHEGLPLYARVTMDFRVAFSV